MNGFEVLPFFTTPIAFGFSSYSNYFDLLHFGTKRRGADEEDWDKVDGFFFSRFPFGFVKSDIYWIGMLIDLEWDRGYLLNSTIHEGQFQVRAGEILCAVLFVDFGLGGLSQEDTMEGLEYFALLIIVIGMVGLFVLIKGRRK